MVVSTVAIRPSLLEPPANPVSRLQEMLSLVTVPKRELLTVVREIYGGALCDVVCEKAELTYAWPERVKKQQIQILLAALGHAVTLDDLTSFLQQKHPIATLLPAMSAKDAKELSSEELDLLCQRLRNPEMLFGGGASFWEELQPYFGQISGPEKRSMALTRQDYAMRQILQHGNPQSPEFAFATGEFLAKLAAYTKPETARKRMLMPVCVAERIVYYSLRKHLHQEGLHAYFYVPLHNPELGAILLFRGTNGPRSAARSLSPGIGKDVFEKYKAKMLHWLSQYAESLPTPSLRLCGHSLGAVDAQRMLASIVGQVAVSPDAPLAKFTRIQVEAYCSPKIDKPTVDRWRIDRRKFKELPHPPKLELRRAEHTSDIFAWAGDFSLDYDEEDEDLDASLMLVSTTRRFPNLHQAHSLAFFNPSGVFDPQGDRSFVMIERQALRRVEEAPFWAEDEDWIVLSEEEVRRLAEQFQRLQQLHASQVGLRQSSSIVWVLSEGVVTPLVAVTLATWRRIFS